MTGALTQLGALLRLRWQMARGLVPRAALILGVLVFFWLVRAIAIGAEGVNPVVTATAIDIAPVALFGFSALAIIAPLTAGGGNEMVPPDQLVAFPVRPRTQFLGGLALAPLNLVWVLQLLVLAALTAFLTLGGALLPAATTTTAYVLFITVLGQALAWWVVGLRQTGAGRKAVASFGALLMITVVLAIRFGRADDLRELLPTDRVVLAITAGALGNYSMWGTVTGALALLTALSFFLGSRACRWALRRPADIGLHRHTDPVRRRSARGGALRELIAVDRASVWRAPALRRGGFVLAVLPGAMALTVSVPWESMIVLPGLVAAGAGLLFGINAFCLDGSGAVWLASLPHDPGLVARAKALVLTETVLGAVVLAAVAGSLRSPGAPSGAQVTAIVASALTCTALVVAGALKLSVRRPHRADLRGPRDAVAPPGALAIASARLALPAACVGVLLGSASQTGIWWWPPLLAAPVILIAVLSVIRSLRRYDDPFVRARIVQTVAAG